MEVVATDPIYLRFVITEFNNLAYPVGEDFGAALAATSDTAGIFSKIQLFEGEKLNIWVTGSSGLILGTLFVGALTSLKKYSDIKIINVKKTGESSHGDSSPLNGLNVFIDDFISIGYTYDRVYNVYKKYFPDKVFDAVILHGNTTLLEFKITSELWEIPLSKYFISGQQM